MTRTTRSDRLLRPLALAALAGTVAATTGCAKRLGFWNRDRQNDAVQARSDESAYTQVQTDTTPAGSSVQDLAMVRETQTNIPTTSPTTNPTTGQYQRTGQTAGQTTNQTTNQSAYTPNIPAIPDDDAIVVNPDPGAKVTNGQVASTDEPEPSNTTPEPGSVHGGDLSAWVYANAMGVELPTESTEETYRATVNVRRVTDAYAGSDFDPIVTPDGRHLVYASTQHRPTADIYTKPIKGSVITKLTDDPAQDVMPAISPDGASLAFASDRSGSWDIYMIPSSGGKTLQLTRGPAHDLHPTFSPDGSKMAFCRLGQQSGRWEIWVQDLATDQAPQFIGYGLFPEWNPVPGAGSDGSELILFQRSRQRGDRAFTVWSIEYIPELGSAGRESEIAAGAGQALINPTWSHDGRFVCFAAVPYSRAWATAESTRPEQSTIWMVSVDGTNKIKLTDGSSVDLMPAWGHDNNVFFVSNMDGKDHLWTMDLSQAVRTAALRNPSFGSDFATAPTDTE